MSIAIFRAMLLGLLRDRGALLMSFVLPAVFFVIMAEIFTATTGDSLNLNVAVLDEVRDETSARLLSALDDSANLRVTRLDNAGDADREMLRKMVRNGVADVGLLLPADADPLDSPGGFGPEPIVIVSDPAKAVAVPMLTGQIRQAYFGGLPDVAMGSVVEELENQFLSLTEEQRAEVDDGLTEMRADAEAGRSTGWSFEDMLAYDEVAGDGGELNLVAYSAGAVAFMFLLFASVHGAVSLLEEQESGVLDRVLAGPGGIAVLVNGKFLYLVLQGVLQVGVIFVVAWLGYGLDLPSHVLPWFVVTVVASCTAAGLAMLLATACRTRRQAQTIANTAILVVSALGGSMVPRIFMPEALQKVGWLTPNTWALEAYSGIFWRQDSLIEIAAPVGAMFGTALLAWLAANWIAQVRVHGSRGQVTAAHPPEKVIQKEIRARSAAN
ncbi:MAG: ABC transporter permease [Gammaproteobacteria bacterium]|nr:ABC transporter permease [Gammaproteobacteria bacterium]